ncbi:MAG: hypothetical protein AB7T63_03945 [Planctomycetota bacterium]
MTPTTCAHGSCTCLPEAGTLYCSTWCEINNQAVPCRCGHEGCGGAGPSGPEARGDLALHPDGPPVRIEHGQG